MIADNCSCCTGEAIAVSQAFYVMEVHTSVDGFSSVFFFRSRDQELLFRWAEEIERWERDGLVGEWDGNRRVQERDRGRGRGGAGRREGGSERNRA